MKCERAKELFSEFHEGSTDYALTETIRCHLDQCASCSHDYEVFRSTWEALGQLPEIEPPVSFRHDVVMRVARLQNEQVQARRRWGFDWGSILTHFAPARTVALLSACAALVVVAVKVMPPSDHGFSAGMGKPVITVPERSTVKVPEPSGVDDTRSAQWRSRKLLRNSLWIAVSPGQNGNESSYLMQLSLNKEALVTNGKLSRLSVRIYQFPADSLDVNSVRSGTPVLQREIAADNGPLSIAVNQPTNLLVVWNALGSEFAQIVMLPSRTRTASDGTSGSELNGVIGSGDVYTTLASISHDYGVPIIANAGLKQRSMPVNIGDGSLGEELKRCLRPANLDWLFADSAVYVDHKYVPVE